MTEEEREEFMRDGREIVADSLYWAPHKGPIYVDDGKMVPKPLLDEVMETTVRVPIREGVTQTTYRRYVRAA